MAQSGSLVGDKVVSSSPAQNGVSSDSKSSPIDVKEFFGKLQPVIEKVMDLYSQAAPYIHSGFVKSRTMYYQYVEPIAKQYRFTDVGSVVLGLVLLFFGGSFAMTIACYTALQISGWPMLVASYKQIRANYESGMEAFSNDKDAQSVFDTNNDGKISGDEIKSAAQRWLQGTKEEKLEILSHFRNVLIAIDPKEVMNGLTGLWSVLITLVATLRSSFAKDIALGVSLGNTLTGSLAVRLKPFIMKTTKIEDDMKPWLDCLIETICKFIGVSIALVLVRVVSAFHSAVKGGAILTKLIFQFLSQKGLAPSIAGNASLDNNIESNQFFIIVQYVLATYGFWYQISSGFALNFFLRLVLFPFVLVETILTILAAY